MFNEPTGPITTETYSTCNDRLSPSLCWKAIIGGTVATIGIHILLTMLGIAAGLAVFSPVTDTNPVAHFSFGAAAVWTICALVSLAFGGLIAGRFSHSPHTGFVHGILVWSLTLMIAVVLIFMGTGAVVGGVLKVVGTGLGIGGKAVASGVGELAKEGAKRGGEQIGSFIDEATHSISTNAQPNVSIRAKREIGFAVTKLFAPGNDTAMPENRTAAIKALVDYASMSEADATKLVDEWTASYKNLKAELEKAKVAAEQKARVLADEAAKNVACVAIWTFFGLLIGLLVAAFGGSHGAKCAYKHLVLYRTTATPKTTVI